MKWTFWIQEKLYCTSQEITILLGLVAVIIVGHGIQIVRAGRIPFDDAYYAETDSLFRVLSARADSMDAVDTVYTNRDWEFPQAEVQFWLFKDTLDKPEVRFPLNINRAGEKELQALPRIGPEMARRIVAFRNARPFQTVGDLVMVRGIGPKTLDQLLPFVSVVDSVGAAVDSVEAVVDSVGATVDSVGLILDSLEIALPDSR